MEASDATRESCSINIVAETAEGSAAPNQHLTQSQLDRIERNRQRAIALRQSAIVKRRLAADSSTSKSAEPLEDGSGPSSDVVVVPVAKVTKVVDTGGGFLLSEEEEILWGGEAATKQRLPLKLVHPPAPLVNPDDLLCEECHNPFMDSFLFNNFSLPICNSCRDPKERHRLITKTTAKDNYLLTDVDLDKRDPPLQFILRNNPHDQRWGKMKLYLEIQVAERALQVWESEDALEEERTRRYERRDQVKKKRYLKEMSELRGSVNANFDRKHKAAHVHSFGEEEFDEATDQYKQTCQECGFVNSYEKM